MRKITLAFILLFGPISLFAQEVLGGQSEVVNNERFIVSANVSYAQLLGVTREGANEIERDFYKKLRSGMSFGASGYYKIGKVSGLGLRYNVFKSKSSVSGVDAIDMFNNYYSNTTVSEDLTISFIGPSYLCNLDFPKAWGSLDIEGSVGYLSYKNKQQLGENYTLKGATYGVQIAAAYRFNVTKNFSVGPQVALLSALLNKVKATGPDGYNETLRLEDGDTEDLSRLDLGITFGYKF
ncbi:MAG: hypothetical protein EOO45_05890 [Flavobacterium sp.]|nr:MAG: hypothetical protein EOO45_05890 [Flavobacterium sp.]